MCLLAVTTSLWLAGGTATFMALNSGPAFIVADKGVSVRFSSVWRWRERRRRPVDNICGMFAIWTK